MFTGIVKGKGRLVAIKDNANYSIYSIEFPEEMLSDLKIGSSVSNNGCCLTVTQISGNKVSFDLIKETLQVTNLGSLKLKDMINLERSVKYGDEIGGHIMSGHVMTTAKVVKVFKIENNLQLWFHLYEKHMIKYVLYKGFIGIDGISLTIGNIVKNCFCVHLIPETIIRTTLATKSLGDKVNIEVDFHTQAVVDTVERIMTRKI